MNREGRLSLDMLIGLSIFLTTFIFIAQFLPTVFADVRSEISLAHEAYKVTVLLAETEGAWSNGTHNGTNWEDYPSLWCDDNFTFLPGLVKDKPDYLSYDKIIAFNDATDKCYEKIQEMLGLKTPDREYNFNVSLESLDSRPYNRIPVTDTDDNVVLRAGKPIPSSGYVSRFERYVWVDAIYELANVSFIPATKGVLTTTACERKGSSAHCSFNYSYPVNFFAFYVNETLEPLPKIAVCIDVDPRQGTCPLGQVSSDQVCVGKKKNGGYTEYWCGDLVDGRYYDFTGIINKKLKDLGAEYGKPVYIKFALQDVNVTSYNSDQIDYLAGKAVAKLVVYVW